MKANERTMELDFAKYNIIHEIHKMKATYKLKPLEMLKLLTGISYVFASEAFTEEEKAKRK